METCTELTDTVSEAVPETVTVPETVAPLAGEVMATETAGLTTLMERLLEAVCAAASFTCTVKGKEPRTEGVPEMAPLELRLGPVLITPRLRLPAGPLLMPGRSPAVPRQLDSV